MNNLLRKITAGILSATMILSGLGTFPTAMSDLYAYAGSDDDDDKPTIDRSAKSEMYTMNGASWVRVDVNRQDWYVLEVTTGIQPGDCVRSIIISFFDADGFPHKEVLYPGKTDYPSGFNETLQMISGVSESNLDVVHTGAGSSSYPGAGNVQFSGSRYSSFSTVLQSSGSDKLAPYLTARLSGAEKYVSMPAAYNGKYPSVNSQLKATPFASQSVERICFKSEYYISSLQSVDFYCEATGNDSWDLKGWSLYRIASDSDPFPQVQLTSGTFVTDSLSLDFGGTLVGKGVGSRLEDSLGFVNSGLFSFTIYSSDPLYIEAPSGVTKQFGSDTVLFFSINIMDSYEAGIESLNKLPGGKLNITEMLTANILYKDVNDNTRSVSLPVFSNAVMDFITNNAGVFNGRQSKLADGSSLSFAQQGESIVFSVALSDFKTLDRMNLYYNNPFDDNDILNIKDITVYGGLSTSKGTADRESLIALDLDSSGNPITVNGTVDTTRAKELYRSTYVAGGTFLENKDSDKTFTFVDLSKTYTPNSIEDVTTKGVKRDFSDSYLVTVNTSDVNFADTTDDVIVSFAYVSMDGKELQTQEYSLSECCQSYYGYNPGKNSAGIVADANYAYCMRQGGSLSFIVDIKNLDHFTGMSVRLGEGGKDDWQMGSVVVSRIMSVGRRTVAVHDGTYGGLTVNRVYDREVKAEQVYSASNKIYVQKGQTEKVDLEKGHYSSETERRDMSEYYYEMDYRTASSELHFDEGAWKYEVIVNVQKNSVASVVGDDCGSNNLFYFQLVFEKGTSAYVLANQQLQHDCFRAGEAESFYVTINENLGEVVSVNIIPDDVTEDSNALDKLCIDSIEIIKHNPDSANKRYVCENVGWINVVYSDNNEQMERPGRNAAELVTAVPVDYSGYMLSLEFAIATDSYTDAEGNTGDQFVGGMKCNIVYRTSSGERKSTGDRDMVDLMYDYAGRMGAADDTFGTVSDPNFMFRANHINRFTIDISDASIIESITLSGRPKTNCEFPLGGISVKVLKSDGGLVINDDGDFQKIYNIEPSLLTDDIPGRKLPHKFSFVTGMYTSYTFNFGDNKIPELDNEKSLNSLVSREPKSCNDTLNLFVYMKDGVPTPTAGKYNVTAKIFYSSVSTANTYVNECSSLKSRTEGGRTVLYAQGLPANNISILTNLKLSAPDSLGDNSIRVDYAIVQQVRNGVVINTYKVYFGGEIVSKSGGVTMSAKCAANTLGYTQTVSLLLGEGTKAAKLVPEEYDIALAIKYTSKANNDSTVLKSAYVFASDSGIVSIHEGSIVEFAFNEAYIDQIVGVEVIAMNGLDAVAGAGNIVCRSVDEEDNIVIDGWYSMGIPTVISIGGTDLPITSSNINDVNALMRAKFAFTTTSQSTTIDSGGTAPIKMIIAYRSIDEQNIQVVIDDIRSCASGAFTAGEEATVELFLAGVKSLSYVKLVPYDDDPNSIASWNLQSVSFRLDGAADSSEHTMPVNRTIYEAEDTVKVDGNISNYINLSTMKMGLKRTIGDEAVYDDNAAQEITVAPGTDITLGVAITGGNSGYYGYFTDRVTGGNKETVSTYHEGYGPLNLTFENTSTENQVYRVTVFSVENPTAQVVLTVNVSPAKIEEKIPEIPPVGPAEDENGSAQPADNGNGESTGNNENNNPAQDPGSGSDSGNLGAANGRSTKKREEEASLEA